nr:histidine kinase [Kitasatospora viridis]
MADVRVGFARACALVAVTAPVPVVWAAAVAVVVWWAGRPWLWIAVGPWACIGTLALARPLCRVFRALVARWTGTVIPGGYREPEPVVQMATGYWWNGRKYTRTSKEAREDQELRLRWSDPANWRDLRFVLLAPLTVGLLAAVPPAGLAAVALGIALAPPAGAVLGVLGGLAAVAASPYAWRAAEPLAVRLLAAPTGAATVAELTVQRADMTIMQAAELRRIERDLHDGAQARLVALGISLATAEKLLDRNPEQAKVLLREARASAACSLSELRELVRGIHPPVLNERGLVDAVRALAMDSAIEAAVTGDAELRLDPPLESALYFGIAELLTNAAKHARAETARISLTRQGGSVLAVVEDDGRGGAEIRGGGGLAGLRRRLAIFDGTLELDSPTGGPTRATMVVPCESL